ncbi:hypothetical protein ACIBO9_04510 [Streptomyces prunicolor]|uniref:hypothetical protein n=1 Tax=Streptomyces prunicolor TaxID=67348 RepID=UPI0037CDE296
MIQGGFDNGNYWTYGADSRERRRFPANNIQKLFALQAFKDFPVTKSHHAVGASDFLPGCYSDAIGVIDSLERALHT